MISLKVTPRIQNYLKILLEQLSETDELVWKNKKKLIEAQDLLKKGKEDYLKCTDSVESEESKLGKNQDKLIHNTKEQCLKKDYELLEKSLTSSLLTPESLKVLMKFSQLSNGPPLFLSYNDASLVLEKTKTLEEDESEDVNLT